MQYINREDPQVVTKRIEYINYIDEHIQNVNRAFSKLFGNVPEGFTIPGYDAVQTAEIIEILSTIVPHHDSSKFGDIEFDPYRRHFHPTDMEKSAGESKEDTEAFDNAWHHHYTSNSHHPQFWCYTDIKLVGAYGVPKKWKLSPTKHDPVDMDIISICHMICDWEAMSMKFGGTTVDWWNNKADKEKSFMSEKTLDTTNKLIDLLFKGE